MSTQKKIIWLASYPKSGNTWVRAFLTALMNDGEVDINNMKTDGIFSSRTIIDLYTDLDSTYLTDEEIKLIQPDVFNELAKTYHKDKLFIKAHDAYTFNRAGLPVIPSEGTFAAIYIIRNPLAVVPSLANHLNIDIDKAIDLLNNETAALCAQKGNLNTDKQTRQLLMNWSEHANSWLSLPPFPVKVIRYEDMLSNPFEIFLETTSFMGLSYHEQMVRKAIDASAFDKLQQQELSGKFRERPYAANAFFRKGASDNWTKELSDHQIERIKNHHQKMMLRFGYY